MVDLLPPKSDNWTWGVKKWAKTHQHENEWVIDWYRSYLRQGESNGRYSRCNSGDLQHSVQQVVKPWLSSRCFWLFCLIKFFLLVFISQVPSACALTSFKGGANQPRGQIRWSGYRLTHWSTQPFKLFLSTPWLSAKFDINGTYIP